MNWSRLNISGIERALRSEGSASPTRSSSQEPLTEDVIRRLIEGYKYVDEWLANQIDVFRLGQSGLLLELNHRVLCGVTPERRVQFSEHNAETERHFYAEGGIGAFAEWWSANRTRSPRILASGVLVHVVSFPQLFIEGNSRTGSLLASYCLARAGLPPLVVTDENAIEFHALVERCMVMHHTSVTRALDQRFQTHRFAEFIERNADPRFLRGDDAMTEATVN